MLVFIDQSGNPHPKDDHPFSVLLAVCMEESQSRHIAGILHNLKQAYLDIPTIKQIYGRMHEIGLESPTITNPLKSAIKANDPTLLELKGAYLAAQKVYEEIPKVRELVDSVVSLNLLSKIHAVFAIVMQRPTCTPQPPPGHLAVQYRNLLEAIQKHMEVTRVNEKDLAVVIFDEYDRQTDTNIVHAFDRFIFQSYEPKLKDAGRTIRIVETPLFVNSALSSGLQLADLFAYIGRIYFTNGLGKKPPPKDLYLGWIKRHWEEIKNKSLDHPDKELPSPGTRYGIRIMKAGDLNGVIATSKRRQDNK
jgi:hypothetical protein